MAEFLNNNIKYLRNASGISQQDLANKVGIDRSTISRIENNEIETTVDNAIKIAKALNVTLYDLVGRDLSLINNSSSNDDNSKNYKKILQEKGLMDENENINEKDFNKLMEIANMLKKIQENEKK